jgi:hypothetical protein
MGRVGHAEDPLARGPGGLVEQVDARQLGGRLDAGGRGDGREKIDRVGEVVGAAGFRPLPARRP